MTEATPKFKRILLKISGEALMGADAYGINRQTISEIVAEIKTVVDMGVPAIRIASCKARPFITVASMPM